LARASSSAIMGSIRAEMEMEMGCK
jgi:hypothetical protein